MSLTAYCKKCAREVEAAEVCPFCGSKLGKNAAHAAWCVERTPARDWLCWNAVMRLLLPAALAVALAVVLAEGISGGPAAVEKLLTGGFLTVLLILLGAAVAVVLTVLLLQGRELTDYVVDNRGVHEIQYLPAPTAVKLLARLKSPSLLSQAEEGQTLPVIKLRERHLSWREVARVQLWPEKCVILFYSPAWWLRIAVLCTPFTWEDVMDLARGKLGKKRGIRLPSSLVIPPQPRARKKTQTKASPEVEEALEQLRMEERLTEAARLEDAADTGPDPQAEALPEE